MAFRQTWLPAKRGGQLWMPLDKKGLPPKVVASQGGCQPKCVPAKMAASQTWLLDKRGCQPNVAASYECR